VKGDVRRTSIAEEKHGRVVLTKKGAVVEQQTGSEENSKYGQLRPTCWTR
jgi:hypothetical protein